MISAEVQSRYKELKHVEKAFRSMKTADLFVRPIRHWNPDRVQGHIFMCMLAYLIAWEARRCLGPMLNRDPENNQCEGKSLREIWEALARITIGRINIPGQQLEQIGNIGKPQRNILKELHISLGKKALESFVAMKIDSS